MCLIFDYFDLITINNVLYFWIDNIPKLNNHLVNTSNDIKLTLANRYQT